MVILILGFKLVLKRLYCMWLADQDRNIANLQ